MALQLFGGKTTVASAGTAVAVGTGKVVWIRFASLTGTAVVGGPDVVADSANRKGIPIGTATGVLLEGGHSHDGGMLDLSQIFVDGVANGDCCSWVAAKP